jgi:molybdate transport system regulatory protein
MQIRQKIWLEHHGKSVFGQGRKILLRAIDQCQSLNAAAKKLNMSYRAAWGRLRATEERLGMKLVQIEAPGGAMRLTDDAREFINKFDMLERETEAFVRDMCQKLAFEVPQTEKREESSQ